MLPLLSSGGSAVRFCLAAAMPRYDKIPSMKPSAPKPEIVTRNGKPVSVILPIDTYRELMERVEDAEDIIWLRKARRKPLRYRSLEEYLAERSVKRRA